MTLLRTLLLTSLPLALALGACVDDNADSGLTILYAAAPEAGCTFTTPASLFMTAGRIDTAAGHGYLIAPEARNDIALLDGESKSPKTVFVTGAEVEIAFYDTTLFTAAELAEMQTSGLTRFRVPVSGSVAPSAGTTIFPFTAVPTELIAAVAPKIPAPTGANPTPAVTVDVQLRLVGTRGGSSIQSNLFHYPVDICTNCLFHHLGKCVDTAYAEAETGGVCRPLQDGHLECCNFDHDDYEVTCMPGQSAPQGRACADQTDQPTLLRCPATPPEL